MSRDKGVVQLPGVELPMQAPRYSGRPASDSIAKIVLPQIPLTLCCSCSVFVHLIYLVHLVGFSYTRPFLVVLL